MYEILPLRPNPHLRLPPLPSLTLCDPPRHEAARSPRRRALTINSGHFTTSCPRWTIVQAPLSTLPSIASRHASAQGRCTYSTTRSSSSYLPALSRNGSETGVLYDAHNVDPPWIGCGRSPYSNQVDLKALTCYWIDLLRVCAVELHCIPIRLFILILDT